VTWLRRLDERVTFGALRKLAVMVAMLPLVMVLPSAFGLPLTNDNAMIVWGATLACTTAPIVAVVASYASTRRSLAALEDARASWWLVLVILATGAALAASLLLALRADLTTRDTRPVAILSGFPRSWVITLAFTASVVWSVLRGYRNPKWRNAVFICHAHSDRQRAEDLAAKLRSRHIHVFLDKDSLPPARTLDMQLKRAVRECRLMVFLVSSASLEDERYVNDELRWAQERRENPTGFLLPIAVDGGDYGSRLPSYVKQVPLTAIRRGNWDVSAADNVEAALSAQATR